MCKDSPNERANTAADRPPASPSDGSPLEYARPDAYLRVEPKRSKFRPFIPLNRPEDRASRTPWVDMEPRMAHLETIKWAAQRLQDAIANAKHASRQNDERTAREYDLSLGALEDCVMRATRGITS